MIIPNIVRKKNYDYFYGRCKKGIIKYENIRFLIKYTVDVMEQQCV